MAQTLNDSEVNKHYTVDCAVIMFAVDLIISHYAVITTLRYLAAGKMQQCSSEDLSLWQPLISRMITLQRFFFP